MAFTRTTKFLGVAALAVGLFFAAKAALDKGMLPNSSLKAVAQTKVETITVDDAKVPQLPATTVAAVSLPTTAAATVKGPQIRYVAIPWNADMGALYAIGGKQTTKGSIMEQLGVNIAVERKDDYGDMQNLLFDFATALSKGERNPTVGVHFVGIMGDGGGPFLEAINSRLKELGDEYTAEVIDSHGYSRGEDKMMGPQEWKDNPKLAKGGVCAGVLRDGDWNIAMKWIGDNGINNNPNEKTYDPDTLNWVATTSFVDAGEKYITGYSEERDVVRNGKKTGEKKKITVNCVVTWTPGDVTVAMKKGGLVSIVSTKEYSGQMPHAFIGIKKWNADNRKVVEDLIDAVHRGSAQILKSEEALNVAGRISAEVWKEENAAYWVRYYKGTTQKDKTGIMVDLGGSKANTLADTMALFGLVSGFDNTFAATYTTFGKIAVLNYPKDVASFPPASKVINTSYLKAVAARAPQESVAPSAVESLNFKGTIGVGERVSNRSWTINFETGSAKFTPETTPVLEEIKAGLLIARNLAVELHGNTDDIGNDEANMVLSKARALAVRDWLNAQSERDFPIDRFRVVGHGEDAPKVPNTSAANRAVNRRVDIVLGTASK